MKTLIAKIGAKVGLMAVLTLAAAVSFASTAGGGGAVDYSDAVDGFKTELQGTLTANAGPILLVLALVAGFWFIWKRVKGLAKSA